MGSTGIVLMVLYALFVVAIATLIVLAIIALVLSIRLLRVRLAEARTPRPLDGIDGPQRWDDGDATGDGVTP